MGAGTVTLLVVGGFALLCAAVVGVVRLTGNEPDDRASATGEGGAEEAATSSTTTIPRQEDDAALSSYCLDGGQAWQEVPPHVPGQPSRVWLDAEEGLQLDNGSFGVTGLLVSGGSTVISPTTDGKVTFDQSVLTRVRAVACVRFLRTDGLGQTCDYAQWAFQQTPDFSAELAQNRYEIVVYELHSGGILHKGEILSAAPDCPDSASQDGSGKVAVGLKEADVMAWLTSHFVDGKPA